MRSGRSSTRHRPDHSRSAAGQLGLDQASLATRVGVSRQWIVAVEAGKARAEVGLVLRTLTAVVTFGDEVAIAVERYDRVRDETTGWIARVHQEDVCQALGIRPTLKYQAEGGPGPREWR